MSHLICGHEIRDQLLGNLKNRVTGDIRFVIIQIGNDGPSEIYVQRKLAYAKKFHIHASTYVLDADVCQEDVISLITMINVNPSIHGVILQLPIPKHLDMRFIVDHIDPQKDIDGLTSKNLGRFMTHTSPLFIPCTVRGCLAALDSLNDDFQGKTAVIVGRSLLVGRPLSLALLEKNITVIMAHSYTKNLALLCQHGDIVVAAAGSVSLINKQHIKKGAVVLDVGITKVGHSIVGDVDFDDVAPHVRAITPVPGGIGPLTVHFLIDNAVKAYEYQKI